MHRNKGKTVAQCLHDRTSYAKNPEKTEGGDLISTFACSAENADLEFALARREYLELTGRERADEVIAYQLRQSFRPGEITPEEANRVGYETAMRFLKGQHAFLVATHTDKAHIHNHIIFNSVALDGDRKFRNFFLSSFAIAKLSDQICLEHRLSVIERPKKKGVTYNKWLGNRAKLSGRDLIRIAIDEALAEKPDGFDALMRLLEEAGWEIKRRGKQISIRLRDGKRFLRLDTLGEEYSKLSLEEILSGKKRHTPFRQKRSSLEKVSLLIDIEAKIKAGKGAGYERWAKVFNVKQMAKAMSYLSEHHIDTYDELSHRYEDITAQYDALAERIKKAESRMSEIAALKKHIVAYVKTREVFAAWRQSGWSKEFEAEYHQEILLHKAAKKAFDDAGLKKLPTVKSLSAEYQMLLQKKQRDYGTYRQMKMDLRELMIVKANVERITEREKETKDHKRDRQKD